MIRSFGLDASSALEALKRAVEKFKDDDLNALLARECSNIAWHLCDHVFKALGSRSRFATLRDLQDHVKLTCPELAYLQDICTETKHGEITRYQPEIIEARHHSGAFSDAFSHDFDISRLEIKLRDGRTFLFNDVVDRAVAFWSKFFDDNEVK